MYIFTTKLTKFTLFLLVLMVSWGSVYAQVPLNDDPCGAFPLTPSASCNYATYTNVDAGGSPGVPNPDFILCGQYSGADVWFTTIVPVGATAVVIDTKQFTMSAGAMAVYTATGSCPTLTLTELACTDQGSTNPNMPKLTINQPAGTLLYVRIYGVSGDMGTFGICVTANIPPVNDNCANATSLTVNANLLCGTVTPGTTINATQSANTPNPCGTANSWNDDVWYTFVATGSVHVITLPNIVPAATSMTMAVYSGVCTGFTLLNCANANTLTLNALTPGTTYYIRVYTNSTTAGATANFNICVGTPPPPPPNDECINATSLTVNPDYNCGVVTAGTTVSATQSVTTPTPSCSVVNGWNDDVWYSFAATGTAQRVSLSNVTGITTDMVTVVYSGTCGSLTELACTDPDPNVINLTGLTIGSIYYIRVMTRVATATSTASFNICVGTPPPPPANDDCAGAVSLTVNPNLVCGTVTAASTISATPTTGVPAPSCSSTAAADDDVWFTFTATGTVHRVSLAIVTPANTMAIVVYSGTCGAIVELGCNTTGLMQVSGLIPGITYYVRVFTTSATIGNNSNFNICITTPPAPPVNDECISAISLTVNPDYLCGSVTAGTTISATPSSTVPVPTCGVLNASNDDVWFKFVATRTRHRVVLSNITGSFTNLVSVVYSGNCTLLNEISCNTINTYDVNTLIPGNTYYVRVFTNSALLTAEASFNLCIGSPPPPPANDECLNAVQLTVNPNLLCGSFTQGTITSATQSAIPAPSCAPGGIDDDVWFKFTATNATHRISLTNITPNTAMAVALYSGNCIGLTELSCNLTNIFHATGLAIGQTYYLRVYTQPNNPNLEVDFRICVGTLPPPPPNDECTGAIPLTVSSNLTCTNPTSGSTLGATQSANTPVPTCSVPNGWNDDIWYSIVATSTSHRVSLLNITGLTTNLITTVYSGTCGSLTLIACNTSNAFDVNNLVIGVTYYIRIHTAVSTFEDASFSICIGSPAPNRTCATSIPFCNQVSDEINFTSTQGTLSVPGQGGSGSIYGCLGTTPNQNWFDIYVVSAGSLSIQISQIGGNLGNDVDFAAWGPFTSASDGCNQLSSTVPPLQPVLNIAPNQIGCSYSVLAIENFKIPNVLPGQVYKLLVTNYSSSTNNLPPFTTPAQFIKLKSLVSTTAGGATFDCNLPCNAATASNTGPVCPGGTFNLSATGSVTPFSWSGPNGFTSSAQNPTGVVAPATQGNHIYTVTIGTGPSACVITTTVVVSSPTAPGISATPVRYCQGATNAVALTATPTASNTLRWYTTSTGGTGSTTSPIPLTATAGSTTYYVSQITAGGCEGPRASLTVIITSTPAAPIVTTPIIYCQNATAVQLTPSGTNLLWYTTSTGGTGSTLAPIPSTTIAGNIIYYVSQSSNTCESPRAAITVTVNALPAPPTTTDLTYCENATTAPLTAGGIAPGATVLWYTAAVGGTGTSTAPPPSNTASSIYYVTQTLNGCESAPRTALNITITPTPAAPTVSSTPVEYCEGATNATLLTATASAGNTLLWYTTATGGTGTATLTPNTTVTTTYYVSQITANGCEGPRTPLTVTITPTPAAPAVTNPASYCENGSAAVLTATVTGSNTLLWYTTATGGIGVATITPSTTTSGVFDYYVSQITANGCEGPRAQITVTVKPRPAPPTTTDLTYCEGATIAPLTAGGIAPGATVLWYTAATGGTGSTTAPPPSNTASSTYYVTQTLNGCESTPRTALNVTITPTPAAPTVSSTPVEYCEGATNATLLTATASAGNTLLWYTTATGGTGTATLTPNTTATTTYYVSQVTSGGCEGPRTPLTVTITPTPAGPAVTNPASYCENGSAAVLTATVTGSNTLLWYTTATGGIGVATITPSTTTSGVFDYYVSQITANGCEGPRAQITVTVKPRPAPPTTTDLTYCEGATIAPLTAGGIAPGATVLWYTAAVGGTGTSTAPPPSNTASSIYYVTQTLNGCESTPRTVLNVTITPTPGKPTVITPVKYCPDETPVRLDAGTAPGNHLLWYTTATGGMGSTTAPTPVTSVQVSYNYYVSQATANGCEGPRDTIRVIVSNNNLSVDLGANKLICQGRSVTFQPIVSSGILTYEWRARFVPNTTIDSIFIKNATVRPVDTAEYILKVKQGNCSVEDTVKVNVIWKPAVDAGTNKAICLKDSVLLIGTYTHYSNNNIKFAWTPTDSVTSPTSLQTYVHPVRSTYYKLTGTTNSLIYGCDFTFYDSVKVVIQQPIKAFAGNDTIAAKGTPHQLHGSGGLHYSWTSPSGVNITNATLQDASVTLNNDANFYLTVKDAVGCEGRDTIFVKVLEGNTYHIPNSFTPNGDGLNDIFRAVPAGMANTQYFRVFNRLGQLMFETNHYLKGWDGTFKGKPQPNGTYVWMVKGTDKNNETVELQGTINIIR